MVMSRTSMLLADSTNRTYADTESFSQSARIADRGDNFSNFHIDPTPVRTAPAGIIETHSPNPDFRITKTGTTFPFIVDRMYIRVFFGVLMILRAMRNLCEQTAHVLFMRHNLKMIRVGTEQNFAQVIDLQFTRNRTSVPLPHHDMKVEILRFVVRRETDTENPVSLPSVLFSPVCSTGPQPTVIGLIQPRFSTVDRCLQFSFNEKQSTPISKRWLPW
jgi:hypothetical protein